jgi:hypothetical protein
MIAKTVLLCWIFSTSVCMGAVFQGAQQKAHSTDDQKKDIYLTFDDQKRPFYIISKSIVPDSSMRVILGQALVTVYMGNQWWQEDKTSFGDARGFGIRVLLRASEEIENDDGTAALVLRELGPRGCEAMINALQEDLKHKRAVDPYYVKELGNSQYQGASKVLWAILKDKKAGPETRVAAAESLTQLGDPQGLDQLKSMVHERTDSAWKDWIEEEVARIERTYPQ